MRTAVLAVFLLAACSREPLDLTIPTLPDATHLDMSGSRAGTRWQYRLQVESRVKQQVRLEARLEEPAPAGVSVRIADATAVIPREGTAWPQLVIDAPRVKGLFRGSLVITSPEVPGWKKRYTFQGEVAREGREGKSLAARPAGVALGTLRPGEEKTLAVAIANDGDETVTIEDWAAAEPDRVRLPRPMGPVTVSPGGEFQLAATVVAPRTAGTFETAVRVRSDATNPRNGLLIRFGGQVVPDYAPNPPRAVERAAYPVEEQEFKVKITAREGVVPFTVAQASGYERYFQVVSLGTPEAAMEQLVRLKLRRDAPTDAARDAEWQVLFRLEPGGVEIAWPLKVRLNPPIHAQPAALDFREVPQGTERRQEVMLVAYAKRTFRVTGARPERGHVDAFLTKQAPGMAPTVIVSLPKSLARGRIDDRVIIETDDPDVPQLAIPVRGEIK
jgi:hypothetical protein